MAESPPRVPPKRGSQSQKPAVGEAKCLGGSKKAKLDEAAFGATFNEALVHESVRAELAARRQGTHATKSRGNVRGGGAKPWRQKGTGRARAGSSRSPIWTGGGTIFGPSPRHYTFKVNRKERRAALRSALSVHAARGSIAVFDPKAFKAPATKKAAALLGDSGLNTPVLVVLSDDQEQVALSFRNIARVSVLSASMVGVADLIGAGSVVCSQEALDALTARAKGERAQAAAPAEEVEA
ncbi:MAG TPA: 50S ribosomal protein L4 [Solirubrobacteraceae bacterium]|nr:50S ribosomal protein L4 [Solirubrobacteraceae bacterium]